MNIYIPLILLGVSLNAMAQICLKKGMVLIGHFSFSLNNLSQILSKVIVNPFIVLGMLCYIFSISIWLLVLSRVEVSFAYPFLSIGYVMVTVMGYIFLNENISLYRVLGIVIICFGLIIMSKSG
jgi:multidrug transporter EmrE-like cation transporter